ncbi:His-Xaa-Ser system protein HxsD [uncultured Odoribacter sp.]|uniref:His-Xaa-Ser system protein HxsD n=1 Tax=uncultured Odoribacter sp. TaxID=876416 RepID=UPI002622F79C|nr:His-Xaa-Ser system protein HxsD [uncultured Odoribacter sp.]
MFLFELTAENKIHLSIDLTIFNEKVVSKVLYWLTDQYLIYWQNKSGTIQDIILEKKELPISEQDFKYLKEKISQDFIDYKNRDIIIEETKNIRNILYVKAFANNDEFEDFNLMN